MSGGRDRRVGRTVDPFEPGGDWSFWDIESPLRAAAVFAEIYGAEASSKARECVDTARADDREDDYRFWTAVYARLSADDRRRAEAQSKIRRTVLDWTRNPRSAR